ncbi:alpha/beta fold hydrolase [Microbacterium sp.]|uniref:alpha/beta fold hydrolase n=1 Tax=Microbacterium sp. TaxID=51671 RepID=UPI0039E214B4
MTLLDGIAARVIDTPRLRVNILERTGDAPETPLEHTIVFLHAHVASSLFWQEIMQDLPGDIRPIAIDLRGFGDTESAPVDATRGVRDFSDDLRATLETLGLGAVHLVGWSLGASVAMQYALEHPVLSLTLQAPISPYGFGGTRRDGTRLTDDDAGCGAAAANPDLVRRIAAGDTSDDASTSPRSVFRSHYVSADYDSDSEDVWVEAMLSTSTAPGDYPGDAVPSSHWPGKAAGVTGVLNALAPRHLDLSGIVGLVPKPPILWIHGTADVVVSDASSQDLNHLGRLGVITGWPGAELAPAQEMVSQTRDVLEAYRAAGGEVTELELEGAGYAAHLERPGGFRRAVLEHIGYLGHPNPALPTEAIILSSSD